MIMEDKDVEQDWMDTLESQELRRDMDAVHTVLQWLREDNLGLEVEVIYWALKFMKEDPSLSIGDAIILGHTEWNK